MKFVLASSSPRRKILLTELLKDLGHKRPHFTIIHANIDESRRRGERPITHARRLAKEKALCVAKRITDDPPSLKLRRTGGRRTTDDVLILAADTIVVLGNQIFGKPRNKKHAAWMLSRLSGRRHRVITAFCVLTKRAHPLLCTKERARGEVELDHAISTVFFHNLSKSQIETYIASKEPHDKAGAYAIQGSKFSLVRKIIGSYTNVVGLPVEKVKKTLQKAQKVPGYS